MRPGFFTVVVLEFLSANIPTACGVVINRYWPTALFLLINGPLMFVQVCALYWAEVFLLRFSYVCAFICSVVFHFDVCGCQSKVRVTIYWSCHKNRIEFVNLSWWDGTRCDVMWCDVQTNDERCGWRGSAGAAPEHYDGCSIACMYCCFRFFCESRQYLLCLCRRLIRCALALVCTGFDFESCPQLKFLLIVCTLAFVCTCSLNVCTARDRSF